MRKDGHLIEITPGIMYSLTRYRRESQTGNWKTNNRIYEASGIYPSYVRPPFGAWIKDMELSVTMLPAFWDVDTLDWKSKNIDSILSIAQTQVHDGSIILMHDGYQTSVDAALKNRWSFTEKAMFCHCRPAPAHIKICFFLPDSLYCYTKLVQISL